MSVHIKATVKDPDDIAVTLTITMPLRDWKRLEGQVSREYPGWRLGSAIADITRRMGQIVNVESMDIEP